MAQPKGHAMQQATSSGLCTFVGDDRWEQFERWADNLPPELEIKAIDTRRTSDNQPAVSAESGWRKH